jgi:antitoxin YobK
MIMKMYSWLDVKEALLDVDDYYIGQKHSDDDIREAENALNVVLPESYKNYLKEWGCLNIGPFEYYGLTKDNNFVESSVPNFVWFTLQVREQVGLPERLVVFQNKNEEIYYCLDTSLPIDGDCKVAVWDNVERTIDEVLDIGFYNFILSDIEEYLDMMC